MAVLSRGYGGSFRGDALVVSDGVVGPRRRRGGGRRAGDAGARAAAGWWWRWGPAATWSAARWRRRFGPASPRPRRRLPAPAPRARPRRAVPSTRRDLEDRPLPAGRLRERPSASARAGLSCWRVGRRCGPERARPSARSAWAGRPLGFFDLDGREQDRARAAVPASRDRAARAVLGGRGAAVSGGAPAAPPSATTIAFTAEEIRRVADEARVSRADAIVTTAKDAVRLPGPLPDLPVLVFRIAARDRGRGALPRASAGRGPEGGVRRERRQALGGPRRGRRGEGRAPAAAVRWPWPWAGASGRLLGALDRRHVAIAAENLRHAFPDWDRERRLRTARGGLRALRPDARGHPLAAAATRGTRSCPASTSSGAEHVDAGHGPAARAPSSSPATSATGRSSASRTRWTFGPIAVVARPLDNPALDRRLCAFRPHGRQPRRSTSGTPCGEVLRALRAGGGVAFLVDQNVQEKDGIFVDFFGRPAATTTVAAALAVKTGCALVPGHTEIGPDGRYRARLRAGAASGRRRATSRPTSPASPRS